MRIERVPLGCWVGVELVLQVLRDGRTSLPLEGRLRKRFFLLSPLDLVPVRGRLVRFRSRWRGWRRRAHQAL